MKLDQTHLKNILIIIGISFFIKFSYFAFAQQLQVIDEGSFDLGILKRHDAYWYEKVALKGHEKITPDQLGKCEDGNIEQSYYAFFPLYPALIGVTLSFTTVEYNQIAFTYSLIFSTLAFILFYCFVNMLHKNKALALFSTLILIVLPFNYYLSTYQTESIYLFLVLASFYSVFKRNHLAIAVFSSLLVLVRPNGLYMLFPLAIFFLENHHSFSINTLLDKPFQKFKSLLIFIVPVLVFFIYCLYLREMTGDFFAFKTAQRGWCRETVFPWVPLLRSSNWVEYIMSAYLIVFMIISLVNFRKIPLSFSILIWINLLLPLVANSITLPRFISTIFIFPIIFGRLGKNLSGYFKVILIVVLFGLQLYTFEFWLKGHPLSY